MNVRPARIEDALTAAELIQETMEGYGDVMLGLDDRGRAVQVIAGFFRKGNNRFSYRLTYLAEIDGQTAGLLLVFPGRDTFKLVLPMSWQILSFYNLWEMLRLAVRAPMAADGEEIRSDEFYVSHLAVLPEFRRQGVGRALLSHADTLAHAAGLAKNSLCVDIDNILAQHLYLSHGYQVAKTVNTPWLKNRLHTRGFHHMVKSLTQYRPQEGNNDQPNRP
jgi:ribosomal protein S18 acetylase RimI-like enzyme